MIPVRSNRIVLREPVLHKSDQWLRSFGDVQGGVSHWLSSCVWRLIDKADKTVRTLVAQFGYEFFAQPSAN
jgi:hypothetical protein